MRTIVMIHGMWTGAWCFSNYEKFFTSKGYKVVSLELPYHGSKYFKTEGENLAKLGLRDYANYLKREINNLDLTEKPIILGHSMGGLLAQMLAADNVSSANIFLTPAAPYGVLPVSYSVIKSFMPVFKIWKFWQKAIDPTRATAFYSVFNNMPFNQQDDLFEFMTPESGRAIFETGMALMDKKRASKIDFSKVTQPTLIISGSLDKIVPKSVVKQTAKKYPNATYKNFDNFAHWIIEEENWEEPAQYIANWLETNLS